MQFAGQIMGNRDANVHGRPWGEPTQQAIEKQLPIFSPAKPYDQCGVTDNIRKPAKTCSGEMAARQ
jgi:hypothetical protein